VQTRDRGQGLAQARGQNDGPGLHRLHGRHHRAVRTLGAVVRGEVKPAVVLLVILVAAHLRNPRVPERHRGILAELLVRQPAELCGCDAIAGHEAVRLLCHGIPGSIIIEHQHAAPGSAQHQRRIQACWSTTDNSAVNEHVADHLGAVLSSGTTLQTCNVYTQPNKNVRVRSHTYAHLSSALMSASWSCPTSSTSLCSRRYASIWRSASAITC
jgi:hypothetical protein